jgi:hypothetical protein
MANLEVDRLQEVETTLSGQLLRTRETVESQAEDVLQLQELLNQNRDERAAERAKHVADRAKLAHQLARSEREKRLLQQAVDDFDEAQCVQDLYFERGRAEAAMASAVKNGEESKVLTRENLRFNRESQRTKRENMRMRAYNRHTRATLALDVRSGLTWRPVRPLCPENHGKWVHAGEWTPTSQHVADEWTTTSQLRSRHGAVSHDFALDYERQKYAVATANECRKRNEDNGWGSPTDGESTATRARRLVAEGRSYV